ncbi:MAG: hypothetical protein ACLP4W_27725 [Mycobacterium sp.]|uniref:hypothetical protein n=1 Tax=Mycobacterium sp. TaxID=1785 RepID=UPI003F9B715B
MTADELWCPVPIARYADSYSISTRHRVRSEERLITHPGPWGKPLTRVVRSRILKVGRYGNVTLSVDNTPISVQVTSLAAAAFGAS